MKPDPKPQPNPSPRRLRANGRAITAIRVTEPGDAPGVKRFPLAHPHAKAFYLSTGPQSVNTAPPLALGAFWIIDDGHKRSAVATSIVNTFGIDP